LSSKNLTSIQHVILFRDLSPEGLHPIAEACKDVFYPAGKTIIEENSVGDSMYIILEGAVKVHKQDFFGGKEVITTLHEGDHFGELSLFDSAPRSAAVTTIKDTQLLELRGVDLRSIMSKDSSLAQSIYRAVISELANRLRETNEHLIYLVGKNED
jgi:CRP/FNR family transcriptional regulator